MSKTGSDARDNVFMKKVVSMYKHFPFFFKPIQTVQPTLVLSWLS